MFQVFADEPAQRGWWFFAFQSGRFHDLGEHCLSILFQFLHEVVASPAEAMQGRLTHACRFRQLLQRGAGTVDDDRG
ncbi:hypothetical protein D9M71_725450 [compost metagenome]